MIRSPYLKVFAAALLGLGLLTLAVAPPVRAGHHDEMDMEKMIAGGDHEALAKHYEMLAGEAREKAKKHAAMAEAYRKAGGAVVVKAESDKHCDRLAKSYEAIAEENDALAKAHREMGKKK